MNMEKCDIFSLGMIVLQACLKLNNQDFNELAINVIKDNESDVN